MQRAHELASHDLGRNCKTHEHKDRLARTVMNFYQGGIHDVGILATISANRERSISKREEKYACAQSRLFLPATIANDENYKRKSYPKGLGTD